MWRKEWGLWGSEVDIVTCEKGGSNTNTNSNTNIKSDTAIRERMCGACSVDLSNLAIVDEVCSASGKNRTMREKEWKPLPITFVEIDPESSLGKITAAAIQAHKIYQTFQDELET